MPTRKNLVVDDIAFETHEPTVVPIDRLYAWVIWQFPKLREGGFSGAVHPPEIGHGWYPAIVNAQEGRVIIYGQVKEAFPSPEAASKHLDQGTKK